MKFCKDCKYSKLIDSYSGIPDDKERHCMHPGIGNWDLVDGEMPTTILTTCFNQRYGVAASKYDVTTALLDCGKEGKYFEPKEEE